MQHYGKYEKAFDPESAYESLDDIRTDEQRIKDEEAEAKKQAKQEEMEARAKAREEAKKANQKSASEKFAQKLYNKAQNEAANIVVRQARKFLKNLLK